MRTFKLPRLFDWLIVTIVLLVFIALLAPQQLSTSLYKLSLVSTAGVVGYWLDRSLFPYARPDALSEYVATDDLDSVTTWNSGGEEVFPIYGELDMRANLIFGLAMVRRAMIVGAAMLAMGLGA